MKKSYLTAWLSAIAALMVCRSSSASLTVNLQFADGSTQYQLTPDDWGNTIPINVWATVTTPGRIGTNNHDGLQFLYFDVLSTIPNGGPDTPGGSTAVDGQIGTVALSPFFSALGSQQGSIMNANSDGVLDLGPDTSPTLVNNTQQMVLLAKPRSTNPTWDNIATTTPGEAQISSDGYSVSFLVETIYFQVNTDNGLETDFNPLIPKLGPSYVPANWFEDDPILESGTVGAQYTKTTPFIAGTGVQFLGNGTQVPEPAAASLLLIGGVASLGRRRHRRN